MVILVCTGVILGAVGIYEPFMKFAGAGAFVPLTGFGYNLWKGIKDAVNEDGFLGLFRGGFKMAAVGTSAALIFSYFASLIFSPKMPKNCSFIYNKNKKKYLIAVINNCSQILL